MLKVTRWSPDTCTCVLEYEWDTEVPEESRVHTPSSVVRACPEHAEVEDVETKFNKVADENVRKNNLIKDAIDNFTELQDIDDSGNITLKNGTLSWAFNAQRVLEVTIAVAGWNNQKKDNLQALADARFGVGKVVIM